MPNLLRFERSFVIKFRVSIHDAIDREGNNNFKNRSFRWNTLRLAQKLFTIRAIFASCEYSNVYHIKYSIYSHLHFNCADENVFVGRLVTCRFDNLSIINAYVHFDWILTVKSKKGCCLELVSCFRCRNSIFERALHFDWLTKDRTTRRNIKCHWRWVNTYLIFHQIVIY